MSSQAITAPTASTTTANTGAINTQLPESSPLFCDEYQSTLSSSYGVSTLYQDVNNDQPRQTGLSSGEDDSSTAEEDEADAIANKELLANQNSETEYKEISLRSFVYHHQVGEVAEYREQYKKMCSAVRFCKAKGQTVTDSNRCPVCGWYAHTLWWVPELAAVYN